MDKKNLKKLKVTIYLLLILFIIAFLTGFLQSTNLEFIIYFSYFILFLSGIKLLFMTLKSKSNEVLKVFLFLTGFSSTIYFLFFAVAFIAKILTGIGITQFMESVEGVLYLVSLAFLSGVAGSIILLHSKGGKN